MSRYSKEKRKMAATMAAELQSLPLSRRLETTEEVILIASSEGLEAAYKSLAAKSRGASRASARARLARHILERPPRFRR